MQVIGHHVFIAMRYSNNDFVELEISWPNDGTELISEWPEAGDMAGTRCIAMTGYAMCFIIFPHALHLRCMSLLSIVLNAIPQIQVGTEMVMEVASRLLHFLVGTALSTTTATMICSTLSSMTCAMPTLLVTFAPLIYRLDLRDGAPHSLHRGPSKDRDLPIAKNLIGDDFGWWMPMERVHPSR
jgi:hypothetical protein